MDSWRREWLRSEVWCTGINVDKLDPDSLIRYRIIMANIGTLARQITYPAANLKLKFLDVYTFTWQRIMKLSYTSWKLIMGQQGHAALTMSTLLLIELPWIPKFSGHCQPSLAPLQASLPCQVPLDIWLPEAHESLCETYWQDPQCLLWHPAANL